MKELHDLELLLNSRTPIIVIESLEETRILQLFSRLGLRSGHPMFQWSVTDGIRRLEVDLSAQRQTSEPPDALKHIKAVSQPGIYVLLDFHPFLSDPIHVRLIKEIAQGHDEVPRTLVFVSYAFDIPKEIKHLTAKFDLQLPDMARLKTLIGEEAQAWRARNNRQVRADKHAVEQLATNLMGVTTSDARRLIRTAIEDDGAITQEDIPEVMKAKYDLLDQGGVIAYEYDTAKFSDIAGLDRLKEWLTHRQPAFHGQAPALDRPKGIMLLGVQGCGKSLAAKAVAGTFNVPLLRLDFGAVYNKFYGETEKNLRQALGTAEVMSPCILWMDEIEKGIARSNSDDGLSQRVLGTLLTWMAEHKSRVFIVATSNDIESLPPELVRKGRLDEIFFVDLPDEATRKAILDIHLRRRNLAPSRFELGQLTEASEGFSGAEIEQAIVSALYAAHASGETLDNTHLLEEISRTRPLSVVMSEKVRRLQQWAADRTVPAH